jgi:dynein heavy chain
MAKEILSRLPKKLDTKRANPETFAVSETGAMLSLGVFVG